MKMEDVYGLYIWTIYMEYGLYIWKMYMDYIDVYGLYIFKLLTTLYVIITRIYISRFFYPSQRLSHTSHTRLTRIMSAKKTWQQHVELIL